MIPNEAFDEAPRGKKNLRVDLVVQPTGDNPWRTRQDYIDDQKKMLWAFRMTIAASLAAIVSALAAVVLVAIELKARSEAKPLTQAEQPR